MAKLGQLSFKTAKLSLELLEDVRGELKERVRGKQLIIRPTEQIIAIPPDLFVQWTKEDEGGNEDNHKK